MSISNDKESREANYYETRDFLVALAEAFKWRSYERGTLGAFKDGEYTKLNWYSVLLNKWISGHGLNYIMTETIQDYDKYKRKVWINNHEWETYDRSRRHDNFIIANSLEAIEDVLLFRLSNYFLRFSEEWKNQHPDEELTNAIEKQVAPMIAINDTWCENFESKKLMLHRAFDTILAEKSAFEL